MVESLDNGIDIVKEDIRQYISEVTIVLEKTKTLKSTYMLYGTTCLEFIGLGSRLALSKSDRLAGVQATQNNDTLPSSAVRKATNDKHQPTSSSSISRPMYQCNKCTRVLDNSHNLLVHMERCGTASTRTYTCTICNKTFNSKNSMMKHRRIHKD
jgi:hypothetical protein